MQPVSAVLIHMGQGAPRYQTDCIWTRQQPIKEPVLQRLDFLVGKFGHELGKQSHVGPDSARSLHKPKLSRSLCTPGSKEATSPLLKGILVSLIRALPPGKSDFTLNCGGAGGLLPVCTEAGAPVLGCALPPSSAPREPTKRVISKLLKSLLREVTHNIKNINIFSLYVSCSLAEVEWWTAVKG